MTQEDLETIKKLIDEGVENKLREYGIIKENTCNHASEKHVNSYKKEYMQDNWYGD